MHDVLVVGAGPAGALAAWRLARRGVRVLLVDRGKFPRHKLCGDTLNPGAVAVLKSLPFTHNPLDRALPLAGMLVTGPHARVEARYGSDIVGRAIERRVFDHWLLNEAIAAGAAFEDGVAVRGALVETRGPHTTVGGALVARGGSGSGDLHIRARMTLAADGRTSVMARSVGLVRHPRAPRRWAFGTYASDVRGTSDLGEMHIRGQEYIGVAPLGDGRCNVCVVTGRKEGRSPLAVVRGRIERDPVLRERFTGARFDERVTVLGPLALHADSCGTDGLLLAGDAAGFIDPMTGDGLHLAMRGALLAADEIARVLENGPEGSSVGRLTAARSAALGAKLRFNRVLRRLVETPIAVDAAGWAARVAPGAVRWAVRYAGDAA